mmetsp:Transcript_23940/g.36218  ORF Transcript_23940/g.36218 Transcript_23940/m.36218 type:complete len:661 (+) Transcript_23940:7-1989(+)
MKQSILITHSQTHFLAINLLLIDISYHTFHIMNSSNNDQRSDEKNDLTILNEIRRKAQEQTLLELSQMNPLLPMHYHSLDPSGDLSYYNLLNSTLYHTPSANFLQQENTERLSNLLAGNIQLITQQDIQQQIQHHSNLLARNIQLTQQSHQAIHQKIQHHSNALTGNSQLAQQRDVQGQIQQQLMLHDPTLAMRLASAAYYGGGVLPSVEQINASSQPFASICGGKNNKNEQVHGSKSKASSIPSETQEQMENALTPQKKASASPKNASTKANLLEKHSPSALHMKKSVHQPTVRGRPIAVLQPQVTHQPLQPGQALLPVQPSQVALPNIRTNVDPQNSESFVPEEKNISKNASDSELVLSPRDPEKLLWQKGSTNLEHDKEGSLPSLLGFSPDQPEEECLQMEEFSPMLTLMGSILASLPGEEQLLDGEENWGECHSLNDFKNRMNIIPQKMQESHRAYLEHRSAMGTIRQAMGWTILPTACQNTLYKDKATKTQIENAIPDEASSCFFILDRRINLDAFNDKVSSYSLLRAWVKDDPHRYIPPPGSNALEYVTPLGTKKSIDDMDFDVIKNDQNNIYGDKEENKSDKTKKIDLFSMLKNPTWKVSKFDGQSLPISYLLETNFLLGPRKRRREQQKQYRLRQKAAIKRLQRIGVVLKRS